MISTVRRKRLALGSSVAWVITTTAALANAQNVAPAQGMSPVSSPNSPAPQFQPVVPAPPRPVQPSAPPRVPTAPLLGPVPRVPGGTTTSQLGAGADTSPPVFTTPAPEAPAIETQLTAIIGRPGGLTADQAAMRAIQTSNDVRAKHADAHAAEVAIDQANAAYVPRLKGTASYQRTSPVTLSFGSLGTFIYPLNNWNLQVDADVPLSDYVLKIARQHSSAEHSSKAAELTLRASELTAASNARIQYYAWARARLQALVAQDALEQTKAHYADVKAELGAGKASQADLLGVQAEVAQNGLLVVRAENAVALEQDRLHTALHDDPAQTYEIGETLLADLPLLSGEENFNELYAESLNARPELRSITETVQGLHLQARANKSDVFPKLNAIGTAQYANPNPRYFPPANQWNATWGVGAALTWSDTDVLIGLTQGATNEARAQSADAQALSIRDGIRDEVMQSWQAVRESEVAIDSTKQSLQAAEESYRVRRALFRAQRATSTELSDSENALTRARFDVVNARIDLRIARVRLMHATGRDGRS